MTQHQLTPAGVIARELGVNVSQIEAAVTLLDEGATVPFIARYRKEATQGLNDTQLRKLAERVHYLRELDERRALILKTIQTQDKLTPDLEQALLSADTKHRLEDLYLPFRPKRRTKAHLAKEAGLEPLAQALWNDASIIPEEYAVSFINVEKGINDVTSALEGARQILMETFSEDADLLVELREFLWQHGLLTSKASLKASEKQGKKDKKSRPNKYTDYVDYAEPIKKIPSHRALALFRGRRENCLKLALTLPNDNDYGEHRIAQYFKISRPSEIRHSWLKDTLRMTWNVKLFPKLELELLSRLRELADEEAVKVFSGNLRDLLLTAPAGQKITMGLDPGIRTGVKVAVVDATGKLLDYTAVFPFAPQNLWHESIAELAKLIVKHHVTLISIGNGTASRDTERLVADMMNRYADLTLIKVMVNEAGASVYSASELAAQEFPDLDVTLRGAISIARRLQDPLAELVKIDPKSIGVGQYQHDVNPSRLARCLEGVVEDCVNAVGVDANTASASLLSRVSGFNETLAKQFVLHRDEHGKFLNREQFKNVPRLGEKTYQQSAGFLRILNGDNPLDASAVHPEAYALVEKILSDNGLNIQQLMGHKEYLQGIHANDYVNNQYGLPTITDVLQELEKPGRDPRPDFKTAHFKDGIETMEDLEVGMVLEGVVSNVTNFGALVDIGVHQDGLVHISALTHRFITDPRTVVKAGEVIQVKVIEVDRERRRIGLSMKLDDEIPSVSPMDREKPNPVKKPRKPGKPNPIKKPERRPAQPEAKKTVVFNTTMADALSKLKWSPE